MTHISGSCLCGAVSYEGDADIKMIMNCHCTDCRKATGSAYGTLLFVAEDSISFAGQPARYDHKSDRGSDLQKLFCEKCGSQMFTKNSARQGLVGVRAGTLDQSELVQPSANVFKDSAIASTPLDPSLPAHAKMPG